MSKILDLSYRRIAEYAPTPRGEIINPEISFSRKIECENLEELVPVIETFISEVFEQPLKIGLVRPATINIDVANVGIKQTRDLIDQLRTDYYVNKAPQREFPFVVDLYRKM